MATLVGKEKDPIKLLHDLCELDHDAVEAYEAAIARMDDDGYKQSLRSFCNDHRRHIDELNACIQRLGGEPVLGGDFKRVLTKGKVVLAGLAGDKAILVAMKTNEDDTNTAYERAVQHAGFDQKVMDVLTRGLSDERRHRAWIERTISAMGKTTERVSRPSMDRPSSQSIV